jgi:hypothetical protein
LPARTHRRRALVSEIANAIKNGGPDDPRVPGLQQELAETRSVEGLQDWIETARLELPPLSQAEVDQVAAIAATLDARLRTSKVQT